MDDDSALPHHVKAAADGVVFPISQQHNFRSVGWVLLLYHLRTQLRGGMNCLEVARVSVGTEFTRDKEQLRGTKHVSGHFEERLAHSDSL